MTSRSDLQTLLESLQSCDPESDFPSVFRQGCELLGYDNDRIAVEFGTSLLNASRWRRGMMVPPASRVVLLLLRDKIEDALKKE